MNIYTRSIYTELEEGGIHDISIPTPISKLYKIEVVPAFIGTRQNQVVFTGYYNLLDETEGAYWNGSTEYPAITVQVKSNIPYAVKGIGLLFAVIRIWYSKDAF